MLRILLVDDDDVARETLADMLAENGYHVVEAKTGRVAMDRLRRASFDLLITDLIMPEMDGLELIRAVRAQDTELPIIAMSAAGSQFGFDFLPYAKAFGANGMILKPVKLEELIKLIGLLASAMPMLRQLWLG